MFNASNTRTLRLSNILKIQMHVVTVIYCILPLRANDVLQLNHVLRIYICIYVNAFLYYAYL